MCKMSYTHEAACYLSSGVCLFAGLAGVGAQRPLPEGRTLTTRSTDAWEGLAWPSAPCPCRGIRGPLLWRLQERYFRHKQFLILSRYSAIVTSCQVYVDNAANRRLGRVGMPLGSMVQSQSPKKTDRANDMANIWNRVQYDMVRLTTISERIDYVVNYVESAEPQRRASYPFRGKNCRWRSEPPRCPGGSY